MIVFLLMMIRLTKTNKMMLEI